MIPSGKCCVILNTLDSFTNDRKSRHDFIRKEKGTVEELVDNNDDLNFMANIYQISRTRLATTLTSAASTSLTTTSASSLLQSTGDGYIVLETNYRLYAYNVTPLQIAILSLFVDLRSRFPNMVMGKKCMYIFLFQSHVFSVFNSIFTKGC